MMMMTRTTRPDCCKLDRIVFVEGCQCQCLRRSQSMISTSPPKKVQKRFRKQSRFAGANLRLRWGSNFIRKKWNTTESPSSSSLARAIRCTDENELSAHDTQVWLLLSTSLTHTYMISAQATDALWKKTPKAWSYLVEGYEGPKLCIKQTKKHAWPITMHVWLLGRLFFSLC